MLMVMHTYFPVFESLPHVFHIEVVGQMAVIGVEAALYFFTLGIIEESRTNAGLEIETTKKAEDTCVAG